MTKKKLHETVLALCTEHNASAKLTDALDALTKPKVGGGSSNVEDYTCFDADGKAAFIFCTYHKKWEPVNAIVETEVDGEIVEEEITLFKANPKAKNGFDRECVEGLKQWKEQAKVFNTSKSAIMADVLDEVITGAAGKEAIAALDADRQIHTVRADGLGSDSKPCEDTEATEEEA